MCMMNAVALPINARLMCVLDTEFQQDWGGMMSLWEKQLNETTSVLSRSLRLR
jgi:hypothetical protein